MLSSSPTEDELLALQNAIYGDCENDADLNAELLALIGGDEQQPAAPRQQARPAPLPPTVKQPKTNNFSAPPKAPPKRSSRPQGSAPPATSKAPPSTSVPSAFAALQRLQIDPNLLKEDIEDVDIPIDDNTDDPDLLAELQGMLVSDDLKPPEPPSRQKTPSPQRTTGSSANSGAVMAVLNERLQMYRQAEANARAVGDGSKARRLVRGITTLQSQLKDASAGRPVGEDDIPPPVAVTSKPKPPAETAPPVVIPAEQDAPVNITGDQHQVAPTVVDVVQHPTSVSRPAAVPPPVAPRPKPPRQTLPPVSTLDEQPSSNSTSESRRPDASPNSGQVSAGAAVAQPPKSPEKGAAELFQAPTSAPKTVLEALEQRHAKYKATAAQAQAEGNGSKARRMGRIQKQYEDALKAVKAGRPFDVGSLPVPPGFPPFPALDEPTGEPPAAKVARSPGVPAKQATGDAAAARPGPAVAPKSVANSKYGQQIKFLTGRQEQFKQAAIMAKKQGNIPLAKKYLLQMKGIEPMLEAAQNGLPVNVKDVPSAPQELTNDLLKPVTYKRETDSSTRRSAGIVGGQTREEVYATLEKDLIRQFQICKQNSEYFTKLGEISNANKFDQLADIVGSQLLSLRNCWKHGDPAPRFHYDMRKLPSLQCCPDLDLNQIELQVIRGLQIRPPDGYEPKHMAVFVKVIVPIPPDAPVEEKTDVIKGTNSPSWKFSFKVPLNRASRALQRAVQHKAIKYEVYQKGHLFRSDKLLATAELKLAALVTDCDIHHSLDLLEGRRPCGGKLEVRVRMREPISGGGKPVLKEEKWAVIDEFVRLPPGRKSAT